MAMDKKSQYFEEIRILRRKISDMEKLKEEHEEIMLKLKESEKQYRILAENTLDWVFWLDPDDRLVYISPSCRRITGYEAEEFMKDSKLLFKIIHQEDRPIFEDHRRFMHKAKSHAEEEFRIITKDGKTRWISHACHAVYDDNGDYAGILSSNCDNTDRRMMEEKLNAIDRQSEDADPVQTLISNISESFMVSDVEGQVLAANETAAARLGTDLKTLMKKKTLFDFMPRETAVRLRKIFQEIQITGKPIRFEDEQYHQTIWNCIYPIAGKDGRIKDLAVFGMDITDRKASEAALLENQRKLDEAYQREVREKQQILEKQAQKGNQQIQSLINSITESLLVIDINGRVLYANETAAKRLGTNLQALLQRDSIFDLISPHLTRMTLDEIQKTGKFWRFEEERFQRTLLNSVYPVENPEGRVTEFIVVGMDITDRKTSEAALLESQRKIYESYRRETEENLQRVQEQTQAGSYQVEALINAVTESFFVMDIEGHILHANETTAKRLGTDLKTLLKKSNIYNLLPPEVAARRKKYLEEVQRTGKPMRFEDERFERTIWNSVYPIQGEDGKFTEFAIFGMDITDRKAANAAVEEIQRKLDDTDRMLKQIIDTIPLRISWKERRLTYLGCNLLFARDAGKKRLEEISGETDQNLTWHDQAQKYRTDDLEVMTTGKIKTGIEEYRTTADGKKIWTRSTKAPLSDMSGRITGVLEIYDDITAQHQAADGLAESEKRYRTLFEKNYLPMLLIDPETGEITDANLAAADYYGWSRDELIRKKIYDINTLAREDVKEEMNQARLQKKAHFHYKHRRADGEIRDVEVFSGPLQFKDKTLLYYTIHDVTEHVGPETVTRRVEKPDSLGILSGGLAHDFNNLMTVVQGHIDVACFDLPDDHSARRALQAAQQSIDKTRDITAKLIAFSRGGNPILKTIHVESLLEDAIKSSLEGIPVDVAYEIPKDLWPAAADESQISQCFGNLAENAGEAMANGGALYVSAENVEVKTKDALPLQEGPYVRIAFQDTGKGIPADDLPRIFDPYFSTKPMGKQKGMGLGLAVCYSILKKHNGYITAASEEGQGTTISLYLPAKPAAGARDEHKETNGLKKRILVMDNHEAIRKLLQLYIEQLGYEVTTVADGQEALTEYSRGLDESKAYRAVILEVSVRLGWGGDIALMKLQNINPDIKAVAIISEDEGLKMDEYKQVGFCNVLSKPFRLEHVRLVLEDIMKT